HVGPLSFAIGYVASVIVSLLAIGWAVRVLRQVPPTALLAGQTAGSETAQQQRRPRKSRWVAGITAVLGVILIVAGGFVHNHEMQAGAFFGGGALLLTAGLAAVWIFLMGSEASLGLNVSQVGSFRIPALGVRNAARNPTRSLLTAGLLAASAFLIVAVESFRREPGQNFSEKNSGSGGFLLLAESDVPIFQDPNSGRGRQEIFDALERSFRAQTSACNATPEE